MTHAYLYQHLRTPRGKGRADGALHEVTPVQLAGQVLSALSQNITADLIEDVLLGCVMPVGEQGGNIGRIAALNAGLPQQVPGMQLNRYCGSGLEAINLAAAKVASGFNELVIAGGVESMSRIPMGADGGAWATDPSVAANTGFVMQGISADLLASLNGLSRRDCDDYALASQQRAHHAWQQGYFDQAILPITDLLGQTLLTQDEILRPQTTAEDLAALQPAFAKLGKQLGFDAIALHKYPQLAQINHVHHAGNSSGVVDGAAAVLVGSAQMADRLGQQPRGRILSTATIGCEPTLMLAGTADAANMALQKAGMTAADIQLWEVNEAFAAVVLAFMQQMDIDHSDINVNGGAIAMGHPLGATGAMLVGTVLDEMARRDQSLAMVCLCEAAGMASATIIERL